MSLIEFEDGLLVDEATGEVIAAPNGENEDALTALLVARLHGAKTMNKEHERDIIALTQVLLKRIDGKAMYGDFMASKRADQYSKLDQEEFALWLKGDGKDVPAAEVSRDDLITLLCAVNAFTAAAVEALPDHLKDPLQSFIKKRDKAPWIDTRPVKRAPGRIKEEVTA